MAGGCNHDGGKVIMAGGVIMAGEGNHGSGGR